MSTINPDFSFDGARLDQVLCENSLTVTAADVENFRRLLGYPVTPPGQLPVMPTSMGLAYGLRLGWENAIFAPGVIRMGDEDVFGVPVCAGDQLVTQFRIIEKFERKSRKFMKYEMCTHNQTNQLVCSVRFTAIVP